VTKCEEQLRRGHLDLTWNNKNPAIAST